MKMPPVKPYKLALKVDAKKGEKKKIYYPNVYDEVHCQPPPPPPLGRPVKFKVVEGESFV
jgi:hypothetical protein